MRVAYVFTLLIFSAAVLVTGQDTNFGQGPQYLMNGSPVFARPISTPSIALEGPPLEVGASNATGVLIAGAQNKTVLPPADGALPSINLFPIYYGGAPMSIIDNSSAEPSSEVSLTELPASLLDTGVSQMTTAQALRDRGYGVTLGGTAVYEKAHAARATHVYTNADIDRLHEGS